MATPRPARLREGLRFLLYLSPLVLLGLVGNAIYRHFTEKDRTIAEQKRIIKELETKLDRSWAEELVADVRVDGVTKDANGAPLMQLTFVQYQPGSEVAAFERSMTLPGDEFYIDSLVVQFDRKFVEDGDGLRGKSMLLFRRAFGDRQKPIDGVPLFNASGDSPIPELAQVDAKPSDFEKKLWARFWDYAGDPKQAAANGIRVAQGEAPHMKAIPGQVYKLTLRAGGGLSMVPRLPAAVVGDRASDAGPKQH